MPELVYPWKRFWYPRGGQISLADDGFLLDPDSEYAKYYASDAVSFDSISETQCMVLLGEPGIGKSTALRAEFENVRKVISAGGDTALWFDLRDYSSDDRLERKVFKCEAIREWRSGQHTLHLFFDSLDEALLNIGNISRVLLSEFDELPSERLRLRIASRPADWQVTLEQGLIRIWGESKVRVFELAPLLKKDVACAAELSGADPEAFVEAITRADVVPLAFKPVTLKFLVGAFAKAKDGTLPASRAELYFEGCRRLCEEPNKDRRDSPEGREKLAAGQRQAIAARIAAVTQFSNRSAIWLGPSEGLEPQDVPLEFLVGGTESDLASDIAVDLAAIREVLDTGLFSSRGLSRQGWRHQTYAEYLAAYYLHAHNVPVERLCPLIQHPDGSGKVIPQLRETAAWLAGLNAQVFELLVRTDADVLLLSDVATASHADRAGLTNRLLKAFESGDVSRSLWDLRHYFAHLDNPDLANIARPHISDPSRPREVRIAAIEIVRACRVTGLLGDLATIALDPNETTDIRSHAAATVADLGDSNARAALRPLALGLAGDDPQDDLKGYGLIATWPGHITPQELFSAVTPIKEHSYFGAYRRFLGSGIAGQLQAHDMETAVQWARLYVKGRDELDAVHGLASDILERAVDHIDQAAVVNLLAIALFQRRQVYSDCDRITARLQASADSARRAVACEMFPAAAADKHGAFIMMDVCALDARDVPWLLSELSQASDQAVRRMIAEVIARRLDPEDVDTFAAVLIAASDNDELRAAIEPLVEPVYLGTPFAEQMKAHHELLMAHRQPRVVEAAVPITQSLSEILAGHDRETFFRVYCLFRNFKGDTKSPTEPLPGWSQFDEELRTRILGVAREYLKTRPASVPGAWWKNGTFSWGMLAGYCALRLLAIESPDSLDLLVDCDWEFWTRIVITYPTNERDASSRLLLVAKAYERAKDTFHATLEDVVNGENERHGRVFVISNLGECWSNELATMLRAKITGSELKPGSFKDVLAKLLQMADPNAKALARRIATDAIPNAGEYRTRAVFATAELISHDPREWSVIWPVLQANETFGVEVLKTVAYEREYTSFATALDEGDIADICIWLSRLGLEKVHKDPDDLGRVTPATALANWWNVLINTLTYKGTVEACDAIRRLIEALPQYEGLQWSLREAEERTRRATWIPPSPEEVIRLASETDVRLIRNGRELVEVLIESLNRLESLLQGVTPSAEELWNELPTAPGEGRIFRPKGETNFSNYVKRHLDRDLRGRGVILNREVEIRAPLGGRSGEDTDIFVDVIVPRGQSERLERISAVIEAKGCWNPDLNHAMKSQLAERYMADSGIHHGIYLVGWFVCPQWDTDDYRRDKTPKIPIEQARHQFEEQAVALSGEGRLIRSVVLNAALR